LDHNDVLIVEGSKGDLFQAAGQLHLEPKGSMPLEEFNQIEEETLRLAELMVPFRSQWVGQSLAAIDFRDRYGLNILAVHRQGEAIREDLPHLSLAAGDTLLVQGPQSRLLQASRDTNLVLVTHLGPRPGDLVTSKAKLTFGALVVMVLAVASGLLDLAVASLIAVVFLTFSRAISLRRAYESIDGSVVVLVGGMLPLAMALQKTGVAEWIAGQLAGLQISSLAALLLLYLFTAVLTQLIPNTVAAALVAPIAINLALAQGQPPETFALAMVVAVAASYLTALTNIDVLLVREPGSYSMRHYLANGLSLFLLQTVAVLILLLIR
jgi:di/tricarboxylate transporter